MSSRFAVSVPDAPGPVWAAVADAHGRRYFSDEFNHRVVVEDVSGETWTFGQRGRGAGDLRYPRGLAVLSQPTRPATRVFVADTWNHRIQVFDGTGALRFSFGGRGTRDGQFRAPADVIVASPSMPWEDDRGRNAAPPLLVVADEWNGRLQAFTPEGAWLATIGGRGQSRTARAGGSCQDGWPFFRLGAVSVPRDPVRLSWQAPWLTVVGANGRAHRIDLAAALLPTREQWVATAPRAERSHARRFFTMKGHGRRAVPAGVLLAIAPDRPVC
jgi:hypothetical protein